MEAAMGKLRHRGPGPRGLAAVAVVAAVLAAGGCGGGSDQPDEGQQAGLSGCDDRPNTCNSGQTKQGGTLTFGVDQDLATWNVNADNGNHFITTQMLTGVLPDVHYAAPDLSVQLNKNLMVSAELTGQSPQTVVYKIRPEAVWSDGTPIGADDFVYAWKTRNGKDCPKCAVASSSGYNAIASVVGSDGGKTVTATFRPGIAYPDWTQLFIDLYPAHLAKANGGVDSAAGLAASFAWFAKTQIAWSGGPWLVRSYTKGQQLIEVPNPKWWGPKPKLDRLVFKVVTDQSSLIPALQNNEIQAAYPAPNPDLVTQAKQMSSVVYQRVGHGFQWEHVDLNLGNKFLADKALRQAIFTAINRQEIITKTVGSFDPDAAPLGSHNFIPGQPAYKDVVSSTGQGSGNVEAAKKILTDAGYRLAGGKLLTPSGEAVPTLRFRHTVGNVVRAQTAELIQAQLKAIGVNISIVTTDDLSGTLAGRDFDIIIYAWVGSPWRLQAAEQIWGAKGGSNFGHWVNDQAEALLQKAVTTLDYNQAYDLLNQHDAMMTQDAYVLPLFQRATYLIAYQKYANIRENPTNTGPQYNNYEWGERVA
jgi:peptide/nickel transport system substrate-binding protein